MYSDVSFLRFFRVAVFLCSLWFLVPTSAAQTVQSRFVYTGGAPTNANTYVNGYTTDPSTGALTTIAGSPFSTGAQGRALASDPAGKFLYVGSQQSNSLSGYSIDANTGALTPVPGSPFATGLGSGPGPGGGPTSVVVDASGRFVYLATGGGSVSTYALDANTGALTMLAGSPLSVTSGAQSLAADPLGKYLYVGGYNGISVFNIDPVAGTLSPAAGPFATGASFLALAVEPSGQFLYGSGNGISAFSVNTTTGALTPVSGSPFDAAAGTFVALTIDPTGTFVYASNSTYLPASTYGYIRDSVTGALTAVPGSPFSLPTSGGNAFYNFGISADPSGKYVYVVEANMGVVPYSLNPATGSLTPLSGASSFGPGALAITSVGTTTGLSSDALVFNDQIVGTSSSQAVTLANFATSILTISSITVAGPNAADFSATNSCGSSLAGGSSCTINVVFAPTGGGSRIATLTFSDNAANSPQIVSLSGTGIPTGLSSTTLLFNNQIVGASSSQTVTLTNFVTSALAINSVTVAGPNAVDFTATNPCGSSLAGRSSCTITVVFSPTASGPRTATLTISDNATNSPQIASLSGNGTDLSLTVMSGDTPSSVVTAGQTAMYNVQINPASGFTGTVSLSCSGAPALSTCTTNPSSISLSGNVAVPVSVTVTTTASTLVGGLTGGPPTHLGPGVHGSLVFALALILPVSTLTLTNHRRCLVGIRIVGLVVAMMSLCACGGGGHHQSSTGGPGTPRGNYTLVVTATSNGVNRTLNLQLTVN